MPEPRVRISAIISDPGWTCPVCHTENFMSSPGNEKCRCGFNSITGCAFCGATSRGPDHARGCPTLAAATIEELYATALAVEAGWRALARPKAAAAAGGAHG
jgi:hypothetical protein